MNKTTLLREIVAYTHDARVQRMVDLGRQARGNASIAALLAALEGGGFYERWLALYACYGSRDGAHVLRAIADPSRTMRGRAMRLAALVCDDAQVHTALTLLPPTQQRKFMGSLAARRRYAPIDAVILAADAVHLPQVLPYGSTEIVERLAATVFADAGTDDWRRLAARHPTTAANLLIQQAQASETFDQRLLGQANAAMSHLAERVPDRALDVVRALLGHISLHQLALDALVLRRPDAIVDLLVQSGDQAQVDLASIAPRLDAARLRALVERGLLENPSYWFAKLAPETRRDLYAAVGHGWRDSEGVLGFGIVRALPDTLRVDEARRNLALPVLATRPKQRLPYAGCLSWDEARAALAPFLRSPDPELRALALPTLIGAARYQPVYLADALQLASERRNEQDPVRMAMLRALASLPPSRWQAEHLPALGQAIRDALDAADCSHVTAATAEALVIMLLPFHPQWSAEWLATLGRERGVLASYNLEQRLTDTDVRRIAPALLPVLRAWEPRERDNAILHTASLFGKRLGAFPDLLAIVERLTRDQRAGVASRALHIIAEHQHERLPALIPALVRADPSWVTQSVVYDFLHRRRQDLLTPFLGQTAYRGLFSTGKTRFVLPFLRGFQRWTPEQQAIFARVLEQVTRDEDRDSPALFKTVDQLAALPAIEPNRIVELADLNAARLATRDTALRALGRLDAGQGIPILLAALDDARARIAIYALRHSLLQMAPERALELLRAVPLNKVTVAKEVIRLLGELPGGAAYADLLALAHTELHRDVRVALLRALWDHLEQPATWPLLEQAAVADDPALAAGVLRIPADRRSAQVLQRLARLLATLLAHPDPKVRLDALQRCATLPITDKERILLPPLLDALDSPLPDERTAAAQAVFATYVGRDADTVGEAVRRILPHRRALVATVEALQTTLYWNRSRMQPTVRAVLAALSSDPLTTVLQTKLAINALLWEDVTALVQRLSTTDELHAEIVAAALEAIWQVAQLANPADLALLESTLAAALNPSVRRIALAALIAQAQPPRSWDDTRVERLQRYRADPAPIVATAAQFTFPPE